MIEELGRPFFIWIVLQDEAHHKMLLPHPTFGVVEHETSTGWMKGATYSFP